MAALRPSPLLFLRLAARPPLKRTPVPPRNSQSKPGPAQPRVNASLRRNGLATTSPGGTVRPWRTPQAGPPPPSPHAPPTGREAAVGQDHPPLPPHGAGLSDGPSAAPCSQRSPRRRAPTAPCLSLQARGRADAAPPSTQSRLLVGWPPEGCACKAPLGCAPPPRPAVPGRPANELADWQRTRRSRTSRPMPGGAAPMRCPPAAAVRLASLRLQLRQ